MANEMESSDRRGSLRTREQTSQGGYRMLTDREIWSDEGDTLPKPERSPPRHSNKRPRTICDDEDDEEEITAVKSEDDSELDRDYEETDATKSQADSEEDEAKEIQETPPADVMQLDSAIADDPPLVIVVIKLRGGRSIIRTPESVGLVRQIAIYAKKLNAAVPPKGSSRLEINDNTPRGQESVIQMLEFLRSGSLPPLTTQNTDLLLSQLCERSTLYALSTTLGVPALEAAIITQIRACNQLDAETFVEFAKYCYHNGPEQVTRHSTLGLLIKELLGLHLPALLKSGAAGSITEEQGALAAQLAEVFVENARAFGFGGLQGA